VVRDAGPKKSCAELERDQIYRTIRDQKRAKEKMKIEVSLKGASSLISEWRRVYGSLLTSTPAFLNPRRAAFLGMHTNSERPIAIKDEVFISPE